MAASRSVLAAGAQTLAGLLAAFLSFGGCFGLLWGGFPGRQVPWNLVGILGSLALAFPLFLLSLTGLKLASLGLSVLIPIHWISTILISIPDFKGGPLSLLELIFLPLLTNTLIGLTVVAALVQFAIYLHRPTPSAFSA